MSQGLAMDGGRHDELLTRHRHLCSAARHFPRLLREGCQDGLVQCAEPCDMVPGIDVVRSNETQPLMCSHVQTAKPFLSCGSALLVRRQLVGWGKDTRREIEVRSK